MVAKLPNLFFLLALVFIVNYVQAETLNGFDLGGVLIPRDQILQGGPPRDGIPALDNPRFVGVSEVKELLDDDIVLGIEHNGDSRAYPIRILNWHEVVNDTVGGKPLVLTYCPLCGSGVAFDSRIGGTVLQFGVSGLLYKSDVLLYDRKTESLWSQLASKAVSGKQMGTKLVNLPIQQTTWKDWYMRYPETKVLDFNTGYQRNYGRNPYAGYEKSNQLYFPVQFRARGIHPKEWVIGIELNGEAKAWPFVELGKSGGLVKDKVGGESITVYFDSSSNTAKVVDKRNNILPATTLFWFAWSGFHPQTAIYRSE